MLYRGITNILGSTKAVTGSTFAGASRTSSIRDVHILYRALWPIETDILQLLGRSPMGGCGQSIPAHCTRWRSWNSRLVRRSISAS